MKKAVCPFKWSLDYARDHQIKNFVIDLSTNGGGSTSILNYMAAIITNKKNHTNANYIKMKSVPTGNVLEEGDILDLNLDGTIDDSDKDVVYDFDFAVLETDVSFSCGTLRIEFNNGMETWASRRYIPLIRQRLAGEEGYLC